MASILTRKVSSSFVFIEDIFYLVNVRILAQLQHDTDSLFVGLVGDIHHVRQLLLLSTRSATSTRNLLIPAPIMV